MYSTESCLSISKLLVITHKCQNEQICIRSAGTLRATLSTEALLGLLPAGWTAQHLQIGSEYTVSFRIHWKQAGRYKNVVKVENL